MKKASSLKSLKKRGQQVVRRGKHIFVLSKLNPKFKAKQ